MGIVSMTSAGVDSARSSDKPVALFVSSSGGVLLELLAIEPYLHDFSIVWAVVRASDTESVLGGRDVHWIPDLSLQRPHVMIRSMIDALSMLAKIRPALIVSAGSGPAFPFFAAARLRKVPSFWLSTLNIHDREGLTARLCSRFASRMFVQQSSLLASTSRGTFIGELY
ncbi:MAG TPA: hypothetical protein VF475_13130 [Sphingobium sp.]